ncbi:excinuclease ABC subunit UvrA [Botrimarina hoheduenensis]|uniref:UvrABC system protein A n=1 Tax=Botrimarina hoheduenensis TaxID=2528000 RepID=A0A5C5WFI8_9BACT|nr:excinuclease ABC subunit UvrA [Botrimarina hoheduenensis]TWT48843.1 UvrABC system protein A [Botrimarina hoheduenensis]
MSTAASSSIGPDAIRIRGARVHNLRNVDIDLPRNRLVVITGVSGSGKSSLAFDTLLAEGQRQYIDSLSVYARQFFTGRDRPDVDRIEGLQPAVAIDQSQGTHSPRSTVGTVTEVHDYLRLLYARAGELTCPDCNEPIAQQAPEEIERAITTLPAESRVMLLAPLVRGRKGKHAEVLDEARKAGFVRVRVDGVTYPIEDVPELTAQKLHDIEAVVDRIVVREGIESRLAESVRLAIKHGQGVVRVVYQTPEDRQHAQGAESTVPAASPEGWRERLFNTRYACPGCGAGMAEVEPRTFSFNSPYGACLACEGLGEVESFDAELVLPDAARSLAGGAIAPWRTLSAIGKQKRLKQLMPLLEKIGIDPEQPLAEAPANAVAKLLRGTGGKLSCVFELLEQELSATKREATRDRLVAFRGPTPCSACGGTRLGPVGRATRFAGKPIHEFNAMSIEDAIAWLASAEPDAMPQSDRGSEDQDQERRAIASPLVREILRRLDFLSRSGVGYLTLDRGASTLSGGELQRVRLATGVGSGLVGVMYLLDEPSIGLHPRDNHRLIQSLRELQQQGNTVIVVEHDEELIRAADWIVDVGPGAGTRGGQIVSQGSLSAVSADAASVTGRYLSGTERIPTPASRRIAISAKSAQGKAIAEAPAPVLSLSGATRNNLQGDPLCVPLGKFVCVTGVSGSGKTSLVMGTLARALARELNGATAKPGPYESLTGLEAIERFVMVDQSPIGRSPRSNAATYTGVFEEIRKLFARNKLSRQRGYKASRFSFNVKGGRCEECQGQGQQRIEMNFLPDLYVVCSACRGARFNRPTLTIKHRGHSIAEVLGMPIDDACELFADVPMIHGTLEALSAVGLGYLSLGQPANTLSGGEAQRIKLAGELAANGREGALRQGHSLYLLDEPTTGLHVADIHRLLGVLDRLVEAGNTVVVIEHQLDVMRVADWIIDLGPDGGDPAPGRVGGGRIVAAGTPEQIAEAGVGHTAKWLAEALQRVG